MKLCVDMFRTRMTFWISRQSTCPLIIFMQFVGSAGTVFMIASILRNQTTSCAVVLYGTVRPIQL